MADPATAAGLALAVIPLIVSALENYEYTFQPIIIFSKQYRKEVEKLQKALKIQKVNFANECALLLHSVTGNRGNLMIDDLEDPLWRDSEVLESRLRDRLSDSYDGCVSSLSLINDILLEILRDTKTLDILLQKVRSFSLAYTSHSPLSRMELATAHGVTRQNSTQVDPQITNCVHMHLAERKARSYRRYGHSNWRLSLKLAQRRILKVGTIEKS